MAIWLLPFGTLGQIRRFYANFYCPFWIISCPATHYHQVQCRHDRAIHLPLLRRRRRHYRQRQDQRAGEAAGRADLDQAECHLSELREACRRHFPPWPPAVMCLRSGDIPARPVHLPWLSGTSSSGCHESCPVLGVPRILTLTMRLLVFGPRYQAVSGFCPRKII